MDIFFVSEEAIVHLVREFYVNLLEHENGVVIVYNTPLNSSLDAIHRIYRLQVFRETIDPYCTSNGTRALWGIILDTICVSNRERL